MKRKSWIGTVALAIIVGLFITCIMNTTKVSADTKGISNDSLDQNKETVIEYDMTLDEETETTKATTTIKEETTVCPPVKEEKEVAVSTETTEPETTKDTVVKNESAKTEDTNEDTYHGCEHRWKSEYQPATSTEEGYLINDCLKCGESYIAETYPPTGEN